MIDRLGEMPALAPNSMNKYGRVVSGPLMVFMRRMQEEFCTPLLKEFNKPFGIAPLSKRPYAFAVDYALGAQRGLNKHYDEGSAVTLNVCLGFEGFAGGELQFYDEHDKVEFVWRHRIGWGVVHLGSHVHKALPLSEGVRCNLILWCSTRFERQLKSVKRAKDSAH